MTEPENPMQAFAWTYMPLVDELSPERFLEIDQAWRDCAMYVRSLGGMLKEVMDAHGDDLTDDLHDRISAALDVAFLPEETGR